MSRCSLFLRAWVALFMHANLLVAADSAQESKWGNSLSGFGRTSTGGLCFSDKLGG